MNVKQLWLGSILFALMFMTGCRPSSNLVAPGPRTFSSLDQSSGSEAPLLAHAIHFADADLAQALAFYQEISGRSVIRSASLSVTNRITFDNASPMTRVEALQALDNVLAANNIVMIYLGTKYVKALPMREAISEPGPVIDLPADQLPDSSSAITYIVRLKHLKSFDAVSALTPFCKLPNSIVAMRDSDVIFLRDYSSNVRRMLKVLEEIDHGPGFTKTAEQILNPKGTTTPVAPRR